MGLMTFKITEQSEQPNTTQVCSQLQERENIHSYRLIVKLQKQNIIFWANVIIDKYQAWSIKFKTCRNVLVKA